MRILGQDDWLFFARTDEGELVYYVSEMDYHWLETPNQGGLHGVAYSKYYGSPEWRVDNSWMHMYIVRNADTLFWFPCDNDPVSGEYLGWPPDNDEEFMTKSRATYLCD
jgi:hypothetical protein